MHLAFQKERDYMSTASGGGDKRRTKAAIHWMKRRGSGWPASSLSWNGCASLAKIVVSSAVKYRQVTVRTADIVERRALGY
jgi:hypothetical protein